MRFFLTLCLLTVCLYCQADYLEVYRNTSIRAKAKSGSERIYEVSKGDLLELLDNGKQSYGYYHVRYPGTTVEGYIYRSLVKRIKGDLPAFYSTTNALEMTVIDVDAGMSAVVELPDNKLIVMDAGLYNRAHEYIMKKYNKDSFEIDMLVLSHTDADHWGSAKELVRDYKVNKILRTNYRANKRSKTLNEGVAEINKKTSIEDINISGPDGVDYTPGTLFYDEYDVQLYFLFGLGDIPNDWQSLSDSKKNNGVSIVVKLVYGDHSIIFTGDAVGRFDGKDGCIASEQMMIDTLDADMLDASILVAAHHGADNGSCTGFIESVSPEYVIFPSGHKHRHPNRSTAERFISYGVPKKNIFRTDTYDREWGGEKPHQQEWNYPYTSSDKDIPMDDNIRIVFPTRGNIQIGYERE